MIYQICPNCFYENVVNGVCNHCGYDQTRAAKFEGVLNPMEIVGDGRYLVGRVLGKGGFGVTYLANDLSRAEINGKPMTVALKECMPEHYAYRAENGSIINNEGKEAEFSQCKDNFREEIGALTTLLDNPFVVDVYESFTDRRNNNEYFVMEYIDGVTVKKITVSNEGMISVKSAAQIIFTIGSALMDVHKKNIIHRDISPENIMFGVDGRIILIDFGAARDFTNNLESQNGSIFLKPGFAPPEQYKSDGNQGPWTDVYALAATFYTIVSGQPLIDSESRLQNDTMKPLAQLGVNIPRSVSDAVQKALAPEVADRYPNVTAFLGDMEDLLDFINDQDDNTMNKVRSERQRENIYGEDERTNGIKLPRVRIMSGIHKGTEVVIPDYCLINVGRDAQSCNLVVDDCLEISRKHCLVGYDIARGNFVVRDISSNGTYDSRYRRIPRGSGIPLKSGEEFYLYNTNYKLKVYLA